MEGAPGSTARRDLALVAVGLLLIFGAFRWGVEDHLSTGSSDYDSFYRPVAERVLAGHGWTDAAGRPATRYPPGEPALVAGVLRAGRSLGVQGDLPVDLVDLALAVATGVGLFWVGRRLFGRSVGWATAAVWGLNPLVLYVYSQPGTEVPYTALLVAVVALLVPAFERRPLGVGRLLAVGALCGAASLFRPVGALLVVAVLALLVAGRPAGGRRALVVGGAVVAAAVVVVAPWVAWSSAQEGRVVPLSTGGPASVRDGLTFAVAPDGVPRTWLPPGAADVVRQARAERASLDSAGADLRFLGHQATTRPFGLAGYIGWKGGRAFYGSESFRYEPLVALAQVVLLALVAVGYRRSRGTTSGRRFGLFALLLLGLNWLAAVAVLPIFWYLMPSLAIASILAGRGLLTLVEGRSGAPRHPLLSTVTSGLVQTAR